VYFATARGGDFDIYRYSFTDKSRTQVVGGRGNQIQPAVSRDGSKLAYVSPVEGRLGTGGLWVTPLDTDAAPRLVHSEETEYRMKPAWTRDGSAFLYVSDEGGSNDVAIVPAEGGNPIILTADPHDEYAPALSPEGERFAFVSNRGGPTTLFTAPVGGGPSTAWREVSMPVRRPRVASGRLRVRVIGQDQRTMPARIYLQASDGRAYAPDKGFPRVIAATETHYFHTTGQAEIEVPAGRVAIEAMRGHEYRPRKAVVDVPARGAQTVTLQLDRLVDLPARGWYSGDTHVHDLHQGRFGLTHETFFNQLVAEDLHVTNALIHMDGTRLMGRWADLTGAPHRLSTADHILQYAEEFRGSLGHIALLGISRYVLPFTGGTPGTAYVSSLLDHQYVDAARAQGGIAGFVHPYNRPVTRPREATQSLIPVDVALGKGDFYDVGALVSDEIGSAEMYYRLLNCGFRLAATAGTDNFSDVWRDPPPGADRTYVWIDGPLSVAAWLAGIKAQRTFASTGPLLFLEVNDRKPGDEIALGADAPPMLPVRAEAISIAPMERLEILVNGSVAQTVRAADPERIVFDQAVAVPDGGWIAARVVGPSSRYVSDSYAFAQTSPVYVVRNGQRYTSPADAQFLADAVTALGERVEARAKWRTPAERQEFRGDDRAGTWRLSTHRASGRRGLGNRQPRYLWRTSMPMPLSRRAHAAVPLSVALVLVVHASYAGDAAPSAATATGPDRQATAASVPSRSSSSRIEIDDLYHLRTAGDPQLSPDNTRIAFTVQYADRPGRPYTRVWTSNVTADAAAPLSGGQEGSAPRWSPDGTRIAFLAPTNDGETAITIANADGADVRTVATMASGNHPLPRVGETLAWSPEGKRIAFVSAVPGQEPPMEADPIVITRYWYRPASSAGARFSDNRRLHLFVVDVETKQVQQLTEGRYDEHSIDWSPDGKKLLFLSNRERDPDLFFNSDIFAIDVGSRAIERLTDTKSNEFSPTWSTDGKTVAYQGLKRPLTSSETNMEDTHVWTLDVATGERREIGAAVDNRQGQPQWSRDGRWVYFTVQSRGTVALHRMPRGGGPAERVAPATNVRGSVSGFAVGADDLVAWAMSTPRSPAELYLQRSDGRTRALTTLNTEGLKGKRIADVEAFTYRSFDGRDVEALLTKPVTLDPARRHPLIVMIHGGPHSQQGPTFAHKSQVYAARGWAVLMVNYRGSTGYGQAFSNAIARDQNGGEARDVLAGVDAALGRYPWIDSQRLGVEGGSYGGQLTNWLVTQTDRFKAAIPWASISNLVSHNYMSVYHDYLEQEYGGKPHTGGIIDMLWERSAIRLTNRVKTPVMLAHGDNDLLVNVAEIEQFYIALKDVGVETLMVRYPREGHGMRESKHVADLLQRSIAWYERHFAR
ncbi:MAG: CehA/McbA family metallohydrolase, partial [Vicinamibacteraceae bacterium]